VVRLVPLLDYSNEWIAHTFLDRVLSKFGVPIKNFTNQDMKFHGESQKMCEKTLIDHHTTSRDHHDANKFIEQMV
jgi:hypothetical protein